MAKKQVISTPKAPSPVRHFDRPPYYSQATKVGNLLFISGMTGRRPDLKAKEGWSIKEGDARAQTVQAVENIRNVLKASGGSLSDVAKITLYITDRKYFDEIALVLTDYFSKSPPALTLVFVPELALEEFLVEIDATAAL